MQNETAGDVFLSLDVLKEPVASVVLFKTKKYRLKEPIQERKEAKLDDETVGPILGN
jgi:hypothetical protein